jgi:hypothetical protein
VLHEKLNDIGNLLEFHVYPLIRIVQSIMTPSTFTVNNLANDKHQVKNRVINNKWLLHVIVIFHALIHENLKS